MARYVIDTKDDLGNRVIFTHKKWREKSADHIELLRPSFMRHVKRAIESPTEVWEDFSDKVNKCCCYRKYSPYSYAKVVIWIKENPFQVITAFDIDYIKEMGYPALHRLR